MHGEPGREPGRTVGQGDRAEPERRAGATGHQHHDHRRRALTLARARLERSACVIGALVRGARSPRARVAATRDRWAILVSEVMLHQTQVPRVAAVWPGFMARFPTPAAMAGATAGRGDRGLGPARLPAPGPPALGDAAVVIARDGWPADLTALPGVGRYTANAVLAQADDADLPAIETNVRRVRRARPRAGGSLGREAEAAMVEIGAAAARSRPAARADGRRRAALPPRDPRCASARCVGGARRVAARRRDTGPASRSSRAASVSGAARARGAARRPRPRSTLDPTHSIAGRRRPRRRRRPEPAPALTSQFFLVQPEYEVPLLGPMMHTDVDLAVTLSLPPPATMQL